MIVIVGRGAGGTRLGSLLLQQNHFYMGPVNDSGDLVPPEPMYEAAKLAGRSVVRTGHHEWNFDGLVRRDPSKEYKYLVELYLDPLRLRPPGSVGFGFKLPETVLSFPWFVKLYPDAHYIHWTRDPRDAVLREHITDYLADFSAPSEWAERAERAEIAERADPELQILCRIESYLYQRKIVQATPLPARFLEVKYEDFVLRHERTVRELSDFVGEELQGLNERSLLRSKILRRPGPFPEDERRALGYPASA